HVFQRELPLGVRRRDDEGLAADLVFARPAAHFVGKMLERSVGHVDESSVKRNRPGRVVNDAREPRRLAARAGDLLFAKVLAIEPSSALAGATSAAELGSRTAPAVQDALAAVSLLTALEA